MNARRRSLGDVLHYFISPEEQRAARARAESAQAPAPPVRWCLPVDPGRPLASALAVDLVLALAEQGVAVEIAAPFPPTFVEAAARGVRWHLLSGLGSPAVELEGAGPSRNLLLLVPPDHLASTLGSLPEGWLAGLILPVNAGRGGLAEARALLRRLPVDALRLRTAAVVIGGSAADGERAQSAIDLPMGAGADADLELLGFVPRDRAAFRSLLRGTPLLELEGEAGSAACVRAVGRSLARSAFAPPAA